MTSQDHPEVLMPPPLLHLGGLFIGYTLDRVFHWQLAPSDERVALALLPALPAVALILVMRFRPEGLWPSDRRRAELHEGEAQAEPAPVVTVPQQASFELPIKEADKA